MKADFNFPEGKFDVVPVPLKINFTWKILEYTFIIIFYENPLKVSEMKYADLQADWLSQFPS